MLKLSSVAKITVQATVICEIISVKFGVSMLYAYSQYPHLLQCDTSAVVGTVKYFTLLVTSTLISQTSREAVTKLIILNYTVPALEDAGKN